MERRVIRLKEEKRISTMSPKTMNKEDVKTILLEHMVKVGNSDMVIEHLLLKNLFEYCHNDAYRKCMREYPG